MRTNNEESSLRWSVRSTADLGRAIAGVRARRRLTQQQLAEQAGLERSYLARLEGGASTLALERALRLLRRMGATVTVSLPEDDGE
jgi:transcriptional regulator with XRE-family HTH domain